MKKGPDLLQSSPLVGIPPFSAYEKTALCLIRAVISVGWQSIFGCFIVYPFVHRRNEEKINNTFEIVCQWMDKILIPKMNELCATE